MEEHHHEIEGKNDLIVNLQAQNNNASGETGSLARATNDKGFRYLIQTKNHEIAGRKAHLNNLRGEKWEVEQTQRARVGEAVFAAATARYSERGSEEFKIRLRTANKELYEAPKKVHESESFWPGSGAAVATPPSPPFGLGIFGHSAR